MFSSLRNYSKNIMQSERFYYDNYDYFNIYENIEKDYTNDLSKTVFHSNRRSTPTIATYGSPKTQRLKHSRLIKGQQEHKTMENFVDSYIKIFMENNYFVPSRYFQKEPCQENFNFVEFCSISDLKYQKQFCPLRMIMMTKQELAEVFTLIIEASKQKMELLQQQYTESQQNRARRVSHVQFNYGIQLYTERILSENYESPDNQNLLLYYEFVVEVHRLMFEILHARMRTILLMTQPKMRFLNVLIHPLLIPIMTFMKLKIPKVNPQENLQINQMWKLVTSAAQQKPRIVFINLDGKESAHNLRTIATLNQKILYVSFYNEPSWIEKKQTMMEHLFESEDENFVPSYSKLWQIYSQAIIQQYAEAGRRARNAKIFLFPLNSSYVIKKYCQKMFQRYPNLNLNSWNHKKFPKIQTSQDIHSLFDHIIYEQIRLFKPSMIFISYNGQLNITEQHFTDIVKRCSTEADHRVVLFPNFTHLFVEEELNINEEEEQIQKIMCTHEFFQKYFEYNFDTINQQRFYSNLTLFLKYSPGLYSKEQRTLGIPMCKYLMSRFYLYLQALPQVEELRRMDRYMIRKWTADEMSQLLEQHQKWEIKENKKQSKYYEKMLTIIIAELLCKNIDESKLESILGKRLFYRLKYLVDELVKEQEELRMVLAQFNGTQINQQYIAIQSKQQITKLLQDYLQSEKDRLLSENFQNYKLKKYFYLGENQKSFGHVSCFKFILNGGEQGQEIYLEKYSQVIVNEDYEQIFIVNYKGADNRHMILHGSIKNSQIQKDIIVTEVKQTDRELSEQVKDYFEHHYLSEEGLMNQRQDIVFIQYNYCTHEQTLYLFWPLMWNLKEEARCKILGLQYKPKRVFKMIKVFQYPNEERLRYENLHYEPPQQGIEVLPRWGCASKSFNQNNFLIFGGVFDNENDFKMVGTGLSQAIITQRQKYKAFTIRGFPKANLKNEVTPCIKPKINYAIKLPDQKHEDTVIKLYGGYGREGTSFFNLFAYEEYCIDKTLVPYKLIENKYIRRVVTTERPLQIDKIGKYNLILNNYNVSLVEQKFSDVPKDKLFFEKRAQGTGKSNEWEILAFIDEAYRTNQFKTDPKKIFLFGFDRTVRQKIYTKCWSPQMYVLDGTKEVIVNLSLKTQKTSSYIITNYLMPREQDIVSLCLEEDKMHLLSNSPIIHSIERAGLKFVLYEGILTNINEVIRRKQIQMVARHNFDEKYQKFLYYKSLFLQQEKIYLVGGTAVQQQVMGDPRYERQDYILEPIKNKFKIKTRKIELDHYNLDMPNSVVVKQNQHYYIYSILFEDSPVGTELNEGIQWKIKIQKHIFENTEGNQIKFGGLRTYIYNHSIRKVQKNTNIDEPKFVRITPYTRFNLSTLREVISKLIWKIEKNQSLQKRANDFEMIRKLHYDTNDKSLQSRLESEWKSFEDLINSVKSKPEVGAQVSFEEQDLLKDIKHAYYLVSKMILEKHMFLGEPQLNEHLFIIEDKLSKKIKYMAVGPLYTTKLNFFRIRFKHELSIILNQHRDDDIFYHPTASGYYKFEYQNVKPGDSSQYTCQQIVKPLSVSIRQ